MTVWVCESGDYEERAVCFVCGYPGAGIAHLKRFYDLPYIVVWDEPVRAEKDLTIIGHFAAVQGHSTEHDKEFTFTEYPVV
jgi:hypothetical protein